MSRQVNDWVLRLASLAQEDRNFCICDKERCCAQDDRRLLFTFSFIYEGLRAQDLFVHLFDLMQGIAQLDLLLF